MSWEELEQHIYPEVIANEPDQGITCPEETFFPSGTLYLPIVSLRIAFIVDLAFADGSYQRQAVTVSDLERWGMNAETLSSEVGRHGSVTPASEWEQVYGKGSVFSPPDFSRDWTYHLLCPDELHAMAIEGQPLIMVPTVDTVIITGSRDRPGLKTMNREAHALAKSPITPRPLIHDGQEWKEF